MPDAGVKTLPATALQPQVLELADYKASAF
jgi:hypothetical protein